MLGRTYQGEIAFLRGMGKEFAAAHPGLAGLLAERGGDPDVERLLEGVAFLTARIRERLEAGIPELVQDLTEVLLPHYLRPVPAASILELTPIPGLLRGRTRVPAGAEFASAPVDGASCRFRSTAPVELVPATVQDAALDLSVGAAPVIRIALQLPAGTREAVLHDDGLRFYLAGELPLAATLLLWLARHLRDVELRGRDGRSVRLGREAVRLPGAALPVLPWPALAPAGYRVLQEYFTLPQKWLFLDVVGLAAGRALAEDRVELVLRFDRPPELPARIERDTFRLGCVPVVNLFAVPGEPIRVEAPGEAHLVRAAGLPPHHAEVHAVEAVEGAADARGARRRYLPFSGYGHGPEGRGARYYRLARRPAVVDDGTDTFLSIGTPRDGGPGPERETLSLELTCTNRALPGALGLGQICVPTASSPAVARFRNIAPVTGPVRPPLGAELHWRLLAHLAVARQPLQRAEELRALLELYNFQGQAEQQAGHANRARIGGVRALAAAPARRVLEGASVRGTRLALEMEEAAYAGPGEAFLFASAIDELLAARAALNTYAELSIRLHPSQREYAWPPRNGARPLL